MPPSQHSDHRGVTLPPADPTHGFKVGQGGDGTIWLSARWGLRRLTEAQVRGLILDLTAALPAAWGEGGEDEAGEA